MPYEELIYNETLMLELLLVALFLFFAVVAIMLFIAIRDTRLYHPMLRPLGDPEKIADSIETINKARAFYESNTSFLLESRKAVSDMLTKNKVGLLLLKNVGNSAAVDIEIKTFGDYYVSDGPETKMVSLGEGDFHAFLFYLPSDMTSNLMLYDVKVRYRSIKGKVFHSKFHAALSPEPKIQLDEETELRVYLQM